MPTSSCAIGMPMDLSTGSLWKGGSISGKLPVSAQLESSALFARPVRVYAEMRTVRLSAEDEALSSSVRRRSSRCLVMSLFADTGEVSSGYTIKLSDDELRVHPGDWHQKTEAKLDHWLRLEINAEENGNVNYLVNGDLRFVQRHSARTIGSVRFMAHCSETEVRNVVVTSLGQCYPLRTKTTDAEDPDEKGPGAGAVAPELV